MITKTIREISRALAVSVATCFPVLATNPSLPCGGGGCPPCYDCPTNGGESQESDGESSYHWRLLCGTTTTENTTGLLAATRTGVAFGSINGVGPLGSAYALKTMTSGYSREQAQLLIQVPDIEPGFFDPSILSIQAGRGAEILRAGSTLRQIVTETYFTDIETLSNPDGFRVRQWHRSRITLGTANPYYSLPSETPNHDVTFKEHPTQSTDAFRKVLKIYDGQSVITTTKDYRETDSNSDGKPDTAEVLLYDGDGSSGDLLEKTLLSYSNYGAKRWDRHVERQVWRAHTVNGSLVPVSATSPTANTLVVHNYEKYEDFSVGSGNGGEARASRLIERTRGYGTPSPLTDTWEYYSNSTNPLQNGRIKSYQASDGYWEYYTYTDSPGLSEAVETKYSSWKDVSFANYTDGRKEVTTIRSDSMTVETSVGGTTISKVVNEYDSNAGGYVEVTTKNYYTGTSFLTTVRKFYPSNYGQTPDDARLAGRPHRTDHSDGTIETWSYSSSGGELVVTRAKGGGTTAVDYGRQTKSTFNAYDVQTKEENFLISGGTTLAMDKWEAVTTGASDFDHNGEPKKIYFNGNTNDFTLRDFSCCGLESETDRNGMVTNYSRDALRRVYKTSSYYNGADVTDWTTDFEGLTTTTEETNGGSTRLISKSITLLNGRTDISYSPDMDGVNASAGEETEYSYPNNQTTEVERPDNSSVTTVRYLDRRIKSIKGDVTSARIYDYGVGSYSRTETVSLLKNSSDVSSTEQIQTTTDSLGRLKETAYSPSFTNKTTYQYSSSTNQGKTGKLFRVTDPDGVLTIYDYATDGSRNLVRRALPNSTGTRNEETIWSAVNDASLGNCLKTVTEINNVEVSATFRSADGFETRTESFGRTSSDEVSRTLPGDGSWTETSTSVDDTYTVTSYTDGEIDKVEVFADGDTLISSTDYTTGAFGWVAKMVDSRIGGAGTVYSTFTGSGQAQSVTDAGSRVTAYTFDKMGRVIEVDQPDTTAFVSGTSTTISNETHTSYWSNGLVRAVWGDQTYPTFREYDAQGRMSKLHTWKTAPTLTQSTATAPAGSAETEWSYDTERGWITSKEYDDGNSTDYTYTDAGRLESREWARTLPGTSTRLKTEYGYDNGILATVTYNDTVTPDLEFVYDSYIRLEKVYRGFDLTTLDPAELHAEYKYDSNLMITEEHLSQDIQGKVLKRHYDSLLRPISATISETSGSAAQHAWGYDYDAAGRMDRVWHNPSLDATTKAPLGTEDFTYGYESDSYGLIKTVTATNAHTVTNTWESTRNVLDKKENKMGATNLSTYDYSVNGIGQRNSLATSGTAFSVAPQWAWGYNERGELVEANDSSTNNDDRAFEFDSIGNRKETVNGLVSALTGTPNYTSDSLNQYSATPFATTPAYDADGNLTEGQVPGTSYTASIGGTSAATSMTWDGENRLKSITIGSTVVSYEYDFLDRRIQSSSGSTVRQYFWDDWNLVALTTSSATLVCTWTWGKDLSGGLQGAGGVGGLLVTKHLGTDYFPLYDGNGNVCQYIKSDGTFEAKYEYDPFGRLTSITGGALRHLFFHRFSTKLRDPWSGLYYYGYRYYDPVTGRWPSRDPIEEDGGLNLYGFVENNGVNWVDVNGNAVMVIPAIPAILEGIAATGAAIWAIWEVGEAAREVYDECQEKSKDGEGVVCWVSAVESVGAGYYCTVTCNNGVVYRTACGSSQVGDPVDFPGPPDPDTDEYPPLP